MQPLSVEGVLSVSKQLLTFVSRQGAGNVILIPLWRYRTCMCSCTIIFLFLVSHHLQTHSTFSTLMAPPHPNKQHKGKLDFLRAPAPPKTKAHPIPPLGYVLIALVAVVWWQATSLAVKLQCIVGAGLFSCTGIQPSYLLHAVSMVDAFNGN